MSVDPDSLKKTMRKWASGVGIVTTIHGDQRAGVTVSSFTSVSLEPPLVLVCLQDYIETFRLLRESSVFAVSLLREDQAYLSAQFAGFAQLPEGADRFYGVDVTTAVTGAPILTNAAAWMDCRLSVIYEGGISRIVVGEVVATGQQEDARPVVYHNRAYYKLTEQSTEL